MTQRRARRLQRGAVRPEVSTRYPQSLVFGCLRTTGTTNNFESAHDVAIETFNAYNVGGDMHIHEAKRETDEEGNSP